jgi:anti-repressor protein
MKNLITIYTERSSSPVISGRELHKALNIRIPYKKWFTNMCKYEFEYKEDYTPFVEMKEIRNGKVVKYKDHIISMSMAKTICALQCSEEGRKLRNYFIEVEETWKNPEAIIEREIEYINSQVGKLKETIKELEDKVKCEKNKKQKQQ